MYLQIGFISLIVAALMRDKKLRILKVIFYLITLIVWTLAAVEVWVQNFAAVM